MSQPQEKGDLPLDPGPSRGSDYVNKPIREALDPAPPEGKEKERKDRPRESEDEASSQAANAILDFPKTAARKAAAYRKWQSRKDPKRALEGLQTLDAKTRQLQGYTDRLHQANGTAPASGARQAQESPVYDPKALRTVRGKKTTYKAAQARWAQAQAEYRQARSQDTTDKASTIQVDMNEIPPRPSASPESSREAPAASQAASRPAQRSARQREEKAAEKKEARDTRRKEKAAGKGSGAKAKEKAKAEEGHVPKGNTTKPLDKAASEVTQEAQKALKAVGRTLIPVFAVFALVLVLFAAVLFFILSSAFGLFASDGASLRAAIDQLQTQYSARISLIESENAHDVLHKSIYQADWRDVLSVYAVSVAQDPEEGFPYELDPEARAKLEEIFWAMNKIEFRLEIEIQTGQGAAQAYGARKAPEFGEVIMPIEPDPTDPAPTEPKPTEPKPTEPPPTEPEPVRIVHLYITATSKTAAEMADELHFDTAQRQQLEAMLEPENAKLWGSLLTGMVIRTSAIPNDGGWVYPLPEEAGIASPFGYRVHPIYNEWRLHAGVDLAAESGTPIYAVRAGTVTVSTYSSSAGNMVVIDHGGGFTSTSMHMLFSVVLSGQTVEQGQIIGYVGSTGDSTGPHLHLGIQYNGDYVDPMSLISWVPPETEPTTGR